MRAILVGLILMVLTAVACSDRVPAPVTPAPSPRPGYPPAPSSELPEGVLFLEGEPSDPPMVFGIGPDGEARAFERRSISAVSPDDTRVAMVTMEKSIATGGWLSTGLGLLSGAGHETVVDDRWGAGLWPMIVWSPEGKSLAYTLHVLERFQVVGDTPHVWVVDADTGATRQLTTEADFYSLLGWSATGEVLARTTEGLVILGKTQRVVPLPEAVEIVDAVLSPDGSQLSVVFGEITEGEQGVAYIHSSGIWIGGPDGGDWRRVLDLTDEPPGVLLTASSGMIWSPDGTRIALHRTRVDDRGIIADGLSVVDVRTGEGIRVHDQGHDQGWGWESWSPDGRYLAYMYGGNADSGQSAGRLGILGPDGRKREVEENAGGIAWAGNGRLLVDIPGRLEILDPETMEVVDVLTEDGKAISVDLGVWSPGGRYVAAETGPDQYHRSSLYVVDTQEGTAELFLDGAGFSAAAWLRE